MAPTVRNPRSEAAAVVGDQFDVRVLEPSPPAVDDGDWYADDPAAVGDADDGAKVVTPTSAGAVTWAELASEDPAVATYAREHGLVTGSLPPVPEGLAEARQDLNRLAFHVLSPARILATGKMALRYTTGGFGTPFFGDDTQVRVEGTDLVVQSGETIRHTPISSVAAAAEFVGVELDLDRGAEFDVPAVSDADQPLGVGTDCAGFLAEWFAFGTAVLEELRLAGGPDDDVGRVQLWPEHFDPAVELGDVGAGARASYGASPGDGVHPEPYLYVAAWGEIDRSDPYWNETEFDGASLAYAELRGSDDPRAAAQAFLREGLGKLR